MPMGSQSGLPPGYRISIQDPPADEDRRAIRQALHDYNKRFIDDNIPFCLIVHDWIGAIGAGLEAYISAGWLFVHTLWVHADLRHRGFGRALRLMPLLPVRSTFG